MGSKASSEIGRREGNSLSTHLCAGNVFIHPLCPLRDTVFENGCRQIGINPI